MAVIEFEKLAKVFRVSQKDAGLAGALKALARARWIRPPWPASALRCTRAKWPAMSASMAPQVDQQQDAHRNSIAGNTAFGVNNSSSGAVAGTCNWWGAANGPGPVGPGSGDEVSTGVTFSPWRISANLNGPCIGGNVPTNKDPCKNDGWQALVDDQGRPFKNQGQCVSYVQANGHAGK